MPVQTEWGEGFHRLLVESALNAIVVVDREGRIILVNRQTEKLFGYTQGEMLGQHVEMLVPLRFREAHPGHRAAFLADPKPRAMGAGRDLFGLRKDGTEVAVEIGLNPLKTPEGTFIVASIIDIGERRQSEERFRLLVEGVKDYAILMLDADGRVTSWNAGAERLKGYQANEIIGRHFSCLYLPEDVKAGKPDFELKRAAETGRFEDENWRVRKDGSRFWANVVITALRDPQGHLRGFSKVTRDFTGRKRTEETLRRSEERFRLVVEAAPNAMVMIGRKGRIVLVNAQAEKLFGYQREDLIGQEVEILVPARFRSGHPRYRESFFRDPQTRAMGAGRDLFGLRKDGAEVPVEIGLNPIKTDEGTYVLAAIIDITERKRSVERFRLTVEAAPNAMVMVNRAGEIVLANAQTEKLFGYGRDELIGEAVEMLVPERYRSRHPTLRKDFFASPQVRAMGAGRDLFGLRKDGAEVPVEIGLNPIEMEGDTFVLAAIIDIAERKRTEELTRQRSAQEATNNELEAFTYTVSHDLRAPVRALQGYASILKEEHAGRLDGEGLRVLGVIQDEAVRLGRLIDDLLTFSRLGRHEPASVRVDMAALVQAVVEEARQAQPGRAVTVAVQALPPTIGDPILLRQVWANLVGNAFKFTRGVEKPAVEIGASAGSQETVYYVKDNGVGFDMQYVGSLFGVFHRLHDQETFEGTGVGLAIVQRIVKRHGGRVWAEGKPGEGATFSFALPAQGDAS